MPVLQPLQVQLYKEKCTIPTINVTISVKTRLVNTTIRISFYFLSIICIVQQMIRQSFSLIC